ncbi:glycine cleavage system protein GcvH [Candidatus Marinamargulisbacteria bacterium SCGC AAA071-K20]|nr:glycine cleavage system protein GcvH [Candidatus Marinamargulisbacteria bacterium SCGC AAA071-K20]
MIPKELRYTEGHEWVRVDGSEVAIGITAHASDELGEIVFVEMPTIGTELGQGDEFGSVESVKTVSSLYSPLSGTVNEINEEIENESSQVNDSPYESGWLIKLDISDTSEVDDLMTAEEYETYLETL